MFSTDNLKQKLIDFYYRHKKGWGWFGRYPDWASAKADCGGYDSHIIFDKVLQSALAVQRGEAAFERDSVLFYAPENNDFLLKNLEKVFSTEGGIHLIDFGGSLGSTYFQHKNALEKYPNLIWCVVEQDFFVKKGNQNFISNVLNFEHILENAIQKYKANAILLSSVLQYLEKPYDVLNTIIKFKIPYIIFDRTPFIDEKEDRITKQIVPDKIYRASYPCWLFSENKMKEYLARHYTLFDTYEALDKNNVLNCTYKGMAMAFNTQ
jgi:putative methyltransferase (TIGR04325 family)